MFLVPHASMQVFNPYLWHMDRSTNKTGFIPPLYKVITNDVSGYINLLIRK
jgi:hypothetical protein